MNGDAQTRARIAEHWSASERGTQAPNMRSTPLTRSWTTRNPASASAVAQRSRRNVVAIPRNGTLPFAGSGAAGICGSASA